MEDILDVFVLVISFVGTFFDSLDCSRLYLSGIDKPIPLLVFF